MQPRQITQERILAFTRHLRAEERSAGTVEKYRRDVTAFAAWLQGRPVTRELAAAWKERLLAEGYAPVTVNSMLAAIHALFALEGWTDCQVKLLKLQRRLFRPPSRELTRGEYERLLAAARSRDRERLALLLETMCATGIRVSEVQYITVEAVDRGRAEIALKGKVRTILLPRKLCVKLRRFARGKKIASGEIFLTRSGKRLTRQQIWAEMKQLCAWAGVEGSKVFPHNLRHLFAATYYRACRDLARLADVLGHSSVDTTRIYLLTSGEEQRRQMDRLGLIS